MTVMLHLTRRLNFCRGVLGQRWKLIRQVYRLTAMPQVKKKVEDDTRVKTNRKKKKKNGYWTARKEENIVFTCTDGDIYMYVYLVSSEAWEQRET